MSVIILHDEGEGRAVLYCNTSETPLPWGFTGEPGVSAYDVAEDFLKWYTGLHGEDPRTWEKWGWASASEVLDKWHEHAHQAADCSFGGGAPVGS